MDILHTHTDTCTHPMAYVWRGKVCKCVYMECAARIYTSSTSPMRVCTSLQTLQTCQRQTTGPKCTHMQDTHTHTTCNTHTPHTTHQFEATVTLSIQGKKRGEKPSAENHIICTEGTPNTYSTAHVHTHTHALPHARPHTHTFALFLTNPMHPAQHIHLLHTKNTAQYKVHMYPPDPVW